MDARSHPGYCLLLAAVAGCISAWIFLATEGWFGVPSTIGLFAPGAIFGALVMAPMLPDPPKHPLRVLVLIGIGAAAHYLLWLVGVFLIERMLELSDETFDRLARLGIAGGPAVIVYFIIVSLAIWRVAGTRPSGPFWLVTVAVAWLCGWLYQVAVMDLWREWPGTEFLFSDADMYVAYVVWYGASSVIFRLARPEAPGPIGRLDLVLAAVFLLGLAVSWRFAQPL